MTDLVSAILVQAKRLLAIDPASALELCTRVSDLAGERDDYCLIRGQCHLVVQDLDGARVWIDRAMALGSADPAGLASLVTYLSGLGRYGAARAACHVALSWFPDLPALHSSLASIELDHDPVAAARAAARARRLDPHMPEALTNAGVLACRRGDHAEGIRLLRAALIADPTLAAAQVNLGTVLQGREKTVQAEAALRRGLRLAPESPAALNSLGVAALSRDDTVAEALFRRAIALLPTYSEALFNLGSLRQGLGDVYGASIIYARANADSFRAIGLFNTALDHIANGRQAEAVRLLRDAVALSPSDAAIRNQLAVALAGLKRTREAMAAIRVALCLAPDVPEYFYNCGLVAYGADETWAALRSYERALLLGFHSPELAISGIGLTRLQAGDAGAGEKALKVALALTPDDQRIYANLGPAFQFNDKPDEGLRALERALRCVRSDPDKLLLEVGRSCIARGMVREGLSYVRRALAYAPESCFGAFCIGFAMMDEDRLPEAEVWFQRAIQINPDYALAKNNLGAVLHNQGRLEEAITCFQQLTSAEQDNAQARLNLAILYEGAKRSTEAEQCYRLVIQQDPTLGTAWNNLGVLLQRAGRHQEALDILTQAALKDPGGPGIHTNLGNLHQKLGDDEEAMRCYRRATALDPAYHLGHYNLGCVLLAAEQPAVSRPHFQRAVALQPDHVPSRYNLACALHQLCDFEAAIPLYRGVVTADGSHYRALNNLALSLQTIGQNAEAAELYARATRVAQKQGVDPAAPGGFCAPDAGRLDDVLTRVEASEDATASNAGPFQQGGVGSAFPAAVWNKSLLDLSIGNLAAGWDGYEFRWLNATAREARGFRQPLWDGKRDIAGKRLLVWREQGIGDEILFASCIPDLAATGARVTVECAPKLVDLFRRSFPGVEVIPPCATPDVERDDLDAHVPIGSLPRFYRRSITDFPDRRGFLKADPARVAYWRRYLEALGPGPYVGMVWRGRVQTLSRSHHYSRIEDWGPILRMPGIRLINMQYDDASAELEQAQALFGTLPHTPAGIDMWNDLADVTALLCALDLLVAVSTAVMSLGGGAGVPTWLLGLENVGWPGLGTDHMPFYPSIRVFPRNLRQPWESILQEVSVELRAALPSLDRAMAEV